MSLSVSAIPKNIWLAMLAGLAILTVGLFLMHKAAPLHQDAVATGFLTDMVITFPVIYYFLVIRPLKLRKWGILLVITCCCTVAYFILPAHQQHYIIRLRELIALPELLLITYALTKIRLIRREYRKLQMVLPDIAYNLHRSMAIVLGDSMAVKFIASEITVVRFGLLCFKRQQYPEGFEKFSIHREIGYAALFGVILSVCGIELVAFHLFLLHYSHTAALVVTLLSVYGTLFLVGDFSAIVKSPVLLMNDQLLLRTGLRWRALVKFDNIASAQKVKDNFEPAVHCFNGGLMKNRVNILFTFTEPVPIERLYRKPINASQIVMTVDAADELIKVVSK